MEYTTFSIVIPTRNEEKLLPRLLDSILSQRSFDLKNIEVLIADANSSDKTIELAKSYSDKLSLKITSGGLPAEARNKGSKLATNQYLLFTDADCIYPPYFLHKLVRAIEKKPNRAYAPWLWDKGQDIRANFIWFLLNVFGMGLRPFDSVLCGACFAVERDFFQKSGGFKENIVLGEDIEYGRRIGKRNLIQFPAVLWMSDRRFKRDGYLFMLKQWLHIIFASLINKKNYQLYDDYFKQEY